MILLQTLTTFNVLVTILGVLILIGVALIILFSRKKEDVYITETKRADANAGLVKVRDAELDDCNKKCSKCNEELDDVIAENRTLVAINIDKLFAYWATRDTELAKMDEKDAYIRRLDARIRLMENERK